MKKNIQARLQDAEYRAKQKHVSYIQRIIKSMKTEDLRKLSDENTTAEEANILWERAENEYKKRLDKKN